MPPANPKPTIILASGAWYPSSSFDPLASLLQALGYTTHSIAWPSITRAPEIKDLSEDIKALRTLVEPEVEAGRDVVVIAHSWAGIPVSSGLDGLLKGPGGETGHGKGGVVKILFIAAFLAEVGQSLVTTAAGEAAGGATDWFAHDATTNTVFPTDPTSLFFHDIPPAAPQSGEYWTSLLRPVAWQTMIAPATSAAYLHVPCAYLLCEDDRIIPPATQRRMVEKAKENGAVMGTHGMTTGHTPWLVDGEGVADWVRREIEGVE